MLSEKDIQENFIPYKSCSSNYTKPSNLTVEELENKLYDFNLTFHERSLAYHELVSRPRTIQIRNIIKEYERYRNWKNKNRWNTKEKIRWGFVEDSGSIYY